MPAPSSKAGAATTTPSGLIRAWAGRRHWPSRQTGTVRACNGTGRSRDLGLRALSHCVGCSNHIQSANDSNFPWLKVGGQVTPSGGSNWRVFFFEAMGRKVRLNRRLCPKTSALIDSVPKVFQACFSILEPKKSVPAHCGLYNGYLRYHLGIEVPRATPPSIRIKDQHYTWQEGEGVLFDDTWSHEIKNECSEIRVVLIVDILRPMRGMAGLVNWAMFW